MYDRVSVFEVTTDGVGLCGGEWLESSFPGKDCNCERRDATEVEAVAGAASDCSDASAVTSCHA